MLGESDVCATIAVNDMDAAKKFYGETLGLELTKEGKGGNFYKSGSGGIFVYESSFAGTNKATYAAWEVSDVDSTAAALKEKGVIFEHYEDMPGVTLEGDVHVMGSMKAVWFKDPSGNILNIVNGMG